MCLCKTSEVMIGQIYACFELKVHRLCELLLTVLCHFNVFLNQTEMRSCPGNKKVPWQTPQQRWMENFIFQLSLGDFSQVSLSNYLSEFHIDYWTMAELQSLHLSPLSSSHRQDCYVFPSFLSPSTPLGFDSHVYGVRSLCWQSPATFMVEGCSACSHF